MIKLTIIKTNNITMIKSYFFGYGRSVEGVQETEGDTSCGVLVTIQAVDSHGDSISLAKGLIHKIDSIDEIRNPETGEKIDGIYAQAQVADGLRWEPQTRQIGSDFKK